MKKIIIFLISGILFITCISIVCISFLTPFNTINIKGEKLSADEPSKINESINEKSYAIQKLRKLIFSTELYYTFSIEYSSKFENANEYEKIKYNVQGEYSYNPQEFIKTHYSGVYYLHTKDIGQSEIKIESKEELWIFEDFTVQNSTREFLSIEKDSISNGVEKNIQMKTYDSTKIKNESHLKILKFELKNVLDGLTLFNQNFDIYYEIKGNKETYYVVFNEFSNIGIFEIILENDNLVEINGTKSSFSYKIKYEYIFESSKDIELPDEVDFKN